MRWEDLPRIDAVLISHNHYDHLDLATLRRLADRGESQFIVPARIAPLLRSHEIGPVHELDWGESIPVGRTFVHSVPAVHFSARGLFDRGITLAWEFSRASRHEPKPGFWLDTAMSAIRGAGFALGASYSFGAFFGITFGVLSTAGQAFAYRFDIRPTIDYKPATRPRLTRLQLLAAANRTAGYVVAGYVSSLVAQQREHAIAVGLKTGLALGVVTAIAGSCTPFIEWTADHVPERRMGVFGVGLILIGFTLQSVQYWLARLDVSVR